MWLTGILAGMNKSQCSGAKIVPVSIERELLSRADAFAQRHKLKRSEMVAKGLRLVMAKKAS